MLEFELTSFTFTFTFICHPGKTTQTTDPWKHTVETYELTKPNRFYIVHVSPPRC